MTGLSLKVYYSPLQSCQAGKPDVLLVGRMAVIIMSLCVMSVVRFWDIFRELAARGPLHHRQVKIPDLLIAAVAARNALTIVHYDSDYDIIASVTGQPTRWGAPRGSL